MGRDLQGTVTTVTTVTTQAEPPLERELSELHLRYEQAKRGEGASPATLVCYGERLRLFYRYLLEHAEELSVKSVSNVTHEHLIGYRDHLLTRPRLWGEGLLSATSVAHHVNALKSFFAFLGEAGVLLLDPCRALKRPRKARRLPRDIPSPAQMKRLLHVARARKTRVGVRDAAILELFYSSALRNSELCHLTLADYDAERGLVFVRQGKGGKDRVVPVARKAREALAAYLPTRPTRTEAEGLFLTRLGRPLNPPLVRFLTKNAARRVGLSRRLVPHTLRHACATHLLKGHADIRHIQALLGHASLQTTELYTKVDTTDLKRVLQRCHPREKKE